MKKIVVTNEKGGTGKSTVACLLVEYLNWKKKKVQLIDTDEIQTSQTWVDNCQAEGRKVSTANNPEYQIIDTAGSGGSALNWLREANLILLPFRPHYADLQTTITWFTSLEPNLQSKVVLIPNQWQKTKEQREGLNQLEAIIQAEKQGRVTHSLSNRPALYGGFLNGSKENFFTHKKLPAEVLTLMTQILTLCV